MLNILATARDWAVNFFTQEELQETDPEEEIAYTSGVTDKIKERTITFMGAFGSFAIALILGLGNGYFFADFQPLKYDPWILMAYGGGFLIEFIAISVLFKSSKHFYERQWVQFGVTFFVVLVFATITMVTQYLMMDFQLKQHNVIISDTMVESIPIFNFMVGIAGLKGSTGFLVMRAAMYHLAEIACVFLVPTRKPDLAETMKIKTDHAREIAAYNQQKGIYDIQKSMDGMMSSIIAGLVAGVSANAQLLVPTITPIETPAPSTPVKVTPAPKPEPQPMKLQTRPPVEQLAQHTTTSTHVQAPNIITMHPIPSDDPDDEVKMPTITKTYNPIPQRSGLAPIGKRNTGS